MIHHDSTLALAYERQTQMIDQARLAHLARAQRTAFQASISSRVRETVSNWRVGSLVFGRAETVPCPC